MNTAILEKPTVDVMDIDLDIDVEDLPVEQIDQIRLTSISLCTPGCTRVALARTEAADVPSAANAIDKVRVGDDKTLFPSPACFYSKEVLQ